MSLSATTGFLEMAAKSEDICAEIDSREMKHADLLKFSKMFASEFNNSSLHDRVLVFQIMDEGWQYVNPNMSELTTRETDGQDAKEASVPVVKNENKLVVDCNLEHYSTVAVNNNLTQGEYSSSICDQSLKISQVAQPDEYKDAKQEEKKEKEREQERKQEGQEQEKELEKEEEEKEVEQEEREEVKEKKEEVKEDEKSENGQEQDDEADDMTVHETNANKSQDEHKIFVHSCWLAVQSPYFRALFYSGMKESQSKEVTMKISESELEAHVTLIEAMYRLDVLNDKDYRLVLEVLTLANKYDVDLVFRKCKYVLLSTFLTFEKCEEILESAKDLPDSADLLSVLEKFLVKEFTPLDKTWTME